MTAIDQFIQQSTQATNNFSNSRHFISTSKMLAALSLLPIVALASPAIVKRDDASINQAIAYINSNITQVNNTLNTFTKPKDAITALEIKLQSDALTKSVTNAASVANASEPLNDDQSLSVATTSASLPIPSFTHLTC